MSEIPFADVRAWLFEAALPFWAGPGLDKTHGGFLEEVGRDGLETDVAFKRVRVTCRHVYAFSHAALLGWSPGAELSARGYEYLLAKARLGGGRWARLLSREGAVIDDAPDLYEHAFVLLALAWRYRLTRDADALALAHETLDFIESQMRAGDGFWPHLPKAPPLLQNPHMHLTEATLALFEATADERFLDLAGALTGLLRRRFFNGRSLGERFDAEWRPAPAELEPGHHFEWAWILAQYHRHSGAEIEREAVALTTFAETHGVDPALSITYDGLDESGAPARRTSRTWPNTERIKAHLALFELTGRDPRPVVASATRLLLDRYLLPNGGWVDRLDESGRAENGPMPASTFYHLFLAFAEVLRLEPLLRQTP